jgi:phosphoribosyl 1,2-cyclic phosphodiesterase
MLVKALASSSAGNCYLISDGSSSLLLECGIPLKDIRRKGVDLLGLSGCLISHEHKDHSKAAGDVVKYAHIYASAGTLQHLDLGPYSYRSTAIVSGKQFKVGSYEVVPFELQHDAEEPLGFLIFSRETGKKLLFATDTFYIHNQFTGVNIVIVECNFDSALLKKAVDDDAVPRPYAKRLWGSHFELSNVKEFLRQMDKSRLEAVYLAHLSDGLSDAKRFRKEIMEVVGVPVYVCDK